MKQRTTFQNKMFKALKNMFIYILLPWAPLVFVAKLYSNHQVICVVFEIYTINPDKIAYFTFLLF